MVQRFSRLGMTTVLEPNHLNSIFSPFLTSTSFLRQGTSPSSSADSLLYTWLDFLSFLKKWGLFRIASGFSLEPLMRVISYARHWGYSSEQIRHDIIIVFPLFCASPMRENPKFLMYQSLTFQHSELSRSWVWKQLKDPLV